MAELLIALALLGVIAAFTIPKVLQNTTDSQTSAKVKATVSTLESTWYNLKFQNNFLAGSTLYDNFTNSALGATLNTAAQGSGNVADTGAPLNVNNITGGKTHPCSVTSGFPALPGAGYGWVEFADGVVVSGLAGPLINSEGQIPGDLSGGTQTANYLICIDVNGAMPPNTVGSDIFYGNFNADGGFDTNGLAPGSATFPTGSNSKNFNWGNDTQPVYDLASTQPRQATAGSVTRTPTYPGGPLQYNVTYNGDGDGPLNRAGRFLK